MFVVEFGPLRKKEWTTSEGILVFRVWPLGPRETFPVGKIPATCQQGSKHIIYKYIKSEQLLRLESRSQDNKTKSHISPEEALVRAAVALGTHTANDSHTTSVFRRRTNEAL